MPSKLPALIAVGSSLAVLAAAAPARADASAWAFIGGGTMVWKDAVNTTASASGSQPFGASGSMIIEAGAGTTPEARFIFGGLFRLQPIFKHGTDIALLARGCTHGFQAGDWGVAIDAGGYLRTWGPQIGGGFAGGVSLGMPLGFTLSIQTEVGTNQAIAVGAAAGIDLLRLTVYRESLGKWWQNPQPTWNRGNTAWQNATATF
ncbi:MAG: hypothetical protein QM820_17085 [Minicystis sp.]